MLNKSASVSIFVPFICLILVLPTGWGVDCGTCATCSARNWFYSYFKPSVVTRKKIIYLLLASMRVGVLGVSCTS